MILSTAELEWVKERMNAYSIEYQEIYDEILDHILTAIEESRANGNTMEIRHLFQSIVNEHFADPENIEVIAIKGGVAYCKNLPKTYRRYIRQHLNWKTLIFALILSGIAYKLPDAKPVHIIFKVAIALLSFLPIIYTYIRAGIKTKTINGKKSLLKGTLLTQSLLPLTLFNLLTFLPRMFTSVNDNFVVFDHLPPIGLMGILFVFLILNISFLQLCGMVGYRKFNLQ